MGQSSSYSAGDEEGICDGRAALGIGAAAKRPSNNNKSESHKLGLTFLERWGYPTCHYRRKILVLTKDVPLKHFYL